MFKSSTIPVADEGSTKFRFCLNTSTISGQKDGLLKYIEIALKAGYDGIEVWIRDVQAYLDDYPGSIPREEQTDAGRVYPGDGVAPLQQILGAGSSHGGCHRS